MAGTGPSIGRLELARAVRATACVCVDCHLAELTLFRRRDGTGRLGLDEHLGDAPDDERNDYEVDEHAHEVAHPELYRSGVPRRFLPVAARRDGSDNRHDEVFNNSSYDLAQRGPDDNRDGKSYDIILEKKCLEFTQHAIPGCCWPEDYRRLTRVCPVESLPGPGEKLFAVGQIVRMKGPDPF